MSKITAHSGCDGMPDNSMEFVRYALGSEGDCFEVDIRRNRNEELILSHDESTEMAVKLSQVFELLKERPDKKINCDLKSPGLEVPVYQLAREYKVENQLIYSGAVSVSFMETRLEKHSEVQVYWNIENLIPETDLRRNINMKQIEQAFHTTVNYSAQCINMEYHMFTDKIIELLKSIGLGSSAWTVNEPEDLQKLMKKGITNITTRNLKTALAIRKEMEG